MATPKKKAAVKAKPAAKAAKPAAAPAKRKKAWLVPVIMLAVLGGVGAQIYMRAKHLASLKFDMNRAARTIPQGSDQGQGHAVVTAVGDKADNTFLLEGNDNVPFRLQRFDKALSPSTLVYKPGKPDQSIDGAVDLDVDAKGQVYVLAKDGRVVIVSNDLKYVGGFKSGVRNAAAITVNSTGRIYVSSLDDNKVVFFTPKGQVEGEFGAPGTETGNLVAPARMRATLDDEIVVIERTEGGLRGKVFRADHTRRVTFLVENVKNCEPVHLGVNAQGKAFLNDHMGSLGLVAYDLSNGKFFGQAQSTKDGEKFINPGSCGANRYNNAVFVHTVSGLIKCTLPNKEEDGE